MVEKWQQSEIEALRAMINENQTSVEAAKAFAQTSRRPISGIEFKIVQLKKEMGISRKRRSITGKEIVPDLASRKALSLTTGQRIIQNILGSDITASSITVTATELHIRF